MDNKLTTLCANFIKNVNIILNSTGMTANCNDELGVDMLGVDMLGVDMLGTVVFMYCYFNNPSIILHLHLPRLQVVYTATTTRELLS